MSKWIDNSLEDRLYMINKVSEERNIDVESIEKDWWVTAILKALFDLNAANYMYFKGGTSLSKGWNFINRFSEDIDITLHRDFFLYELDKECAKCENNNQIKNLRKASRDYVLGDFKAELEKRLTAMGLTGITIEPATTHMTSDGEQPIDHDADPTVLLVHYRSIFGAINSYVEPVVKIEISCLSMKEPYEVKRITSLIYDEFETEDDEIVSEIATISPARTFLEKTFLLNEEYQRNKPRTLRMSRHLYDLERLMDSEYGNKALNDIVLYKEIVEHRKVFYHLGGVDYALNMPETISFCPVGEIRDKMNEDYQKMKSSFIYGTPLEFDDLMKRLEELQNRFRAIAVE